MRNSLEKHPLQAKRKNIPISNTTLSGRDEGVTEGITKGITQGMTQGITEGMTVRCSHGRCNEGLCGGVPA